jgi:TonB family protein
MTGAPSFTGNLKPHIERRLHLRHRLGAIAYLDIGADNGGIVLNISEDGLELQAVGPLDKQTELRLRIKAPNSQTRIEVSAQIVWLSDTNRQAGVRFRDMRLGDLLVIQDWIQSQSASRAPRAAEPSKQKEITAEYERKRETIRELRDKWLSLMPELGSSLTGPQKSLEVDRGSQGLDAPPCDEAPESFRKPAPESPQFADGAKWLSPQPPKKVASDTGEYQGRNATSSLEPDTGATAKISPNQNMISSKPILAEPIPPFRALSVATPTSRTSRDPMPGLVKPPVSAAESRTNLMPGLLNAAPAGAAATEGILSRKQAIFAVFFAVCSVVFFSIGRWVGHVSPRRQAAQTVERRENPAPAIEPTTGESAARDPNSVGLPAPDKSHAGHVSRRPALEKDAIAPSTRSSSALPEVQNVPSNKPPDPTLTMPATMEQPENVEPVTAPRDSAEPASGPRIVAGRTLKPSDRFNQCYLSYRVDPAYPLEAKQKGIEGVVKIEQVIGPDGSVRRVKLLSGPPLLAPAALEAARYWRYFPALLNGQPVETEQEITIDFRLTP